MESILAYIGAFALGIGLMLLIKWLRSSSATTAGEAIAETLEEIDDETKTAIEHSPDKPTADSADAADERVQDAAAEHDVTLTDEDGFSGEPVGDVDDLDALDLIGDDEV